MNQAEAMKLLLDNRRLFIETLMRIENKERELVPFVLNPIQSDICDTSTGRDVYVKPAQVGASSYFICDFLIDCLTIPGTTSVIISYDEFITGRLLRKAQVFYDILLERIPSIPRMHHKSTYEKTFPDVNGSFFISSARSFTSVRGETVHNLLADEFAFWQPGEPEKVFAAVLQRVPLLPNTKIKIASTPNGEDNDFYELYLAAKEGKEVGKSVFKAHFYRWFDHPEYMLPYDHPLVLPGDNIPELFNLLPEEEKLMMNFGLTFDQIRWRRYKIAEMESLRRSGETRLLFQQEYPEDDVNCFLTAGDMVYDTNILNDLARNCYPAPIHNLFADIWYHPEEGVKYVLSIDPGVGKVSESVAHVWSFREAVADKDGKVVSPAEYKHCATLCGRYNEPEMAEKSKDLARYYNLATIAAEANLSIVPHLLDYPNLYYRTDPITGRVGRDIGWLTTRLTKPYMIKELNVNMSKITTHDIRFVSQCKNIRWIGAGVRQIAVSLGADDHHDAGCIAIVCRDSIPMEKGVAAEVAGWKDGWGE
jgi:hypothetical protein